MRMHMRGGHDDANLNSGYEDAAGKFVSLSTHLLNSLLYISVHHSYFKSTLPILQTHPSYSFLILHIHCNNPLHSHTHCSLPIHVRRDYCAWPPSSPYFSMPRYPFSLIDIFPSTPFTFIPILLTNSLTTHSPLIHLSIPCALHTHFSSSLPNILTPPYLSFILPIPILHAAHTHSLLMLLRVVHPWSPSMPPCISPHFSLYTTCPSCAVVG